MKGMTAEVGRTDWLSYPTENFIEKNYRIEPPAGTIPDKSGSNHPAVLLSKDRGIERTGKRDAERSISGVYTRADPPTGGELTDEVSKLT